MAVIEIQAKTLLAHIRQPDEIFGLQYNMNLYRGCQHQCIYCDSRSECYQIENFNDILVKINGPALLAQELPRKRVKGIIGTGSMHDPYMPIEKHYRLTRQALELIARHGFGVHINTKGDLILRDGDVLQDICRVHVSACFSISTCDDAFSRQIEPGAPPVSARFAAMRALAEQGIPVGTCMMPILPFLEDTPENMRTVVERTAENGGSFIVPWFGMSLRDRQRDYYYQHLDRLWPGLRQKYEQAFGPRYGCAARDALALSALFNELCQRYGLKTHVPHPHKAAGQEAQQLSLFS